MTLQQQLIVVQVVSVVGIVVAGWLVYDSYKDYKLVRPERDHLLQHLALVRFGGEVVRLLMQVMFLIVAIVFSTERSSVRMRDQAILILITIPVFLAGWSIWSWWYRWKMLDEKTSRQEEASE